MPRPNIVYRRQEALYINITNRCPTACAFCVKAPWKMRYEGRDLRLSREPTAEEVLQALSEAGSCREVVFCGYGESTYRLLVVCALARRLRRAFPGMRLRLNTIGLGSLINGRDIVPELRGCIDAVSVSLNTADPVQWRELHAPAKPFRARGFEAVTEFARSCAAAGLDTVATAVELPGVDLKAVAALAASLGARFRVRPSLT